MDTSVPTPEDVLGFYSDSDTDDTAQPLQEAESLGEEGADEEKAPDDGQNEVESTSLDGKVVTICGPGISLGQLFVENEFGRALGDEIWAVDNVGKLIQYSRLFLMEHPSKYDDAKMSWASDVQNAPVYVSELDPRVPAGVMYPIQEVVDSLGLLYISSSAAYALALAISRRASKVRLFGLDFEADPVKRGCIEFLICKAVHTGINVEIPSTSLILGNNLTVQKRLFGFEHCQDPFVLGNRDGKRCLMRASELPDQYTVAS